MRQPRLARGVAGRRRPDPATVWEQRWDQCTKLLLDNMRKRTLFKGVVPGLARSTVANGCSMVVYEAVHTRLSRAFGVDRRDVT